jgi:aryl-alcohol dehydrogenase-like predicted oxidoreductase
MEHSMRRLQTSRIDPMQVHNLLDWRTQLATLRDWKAAGRIRYLGITHYTASAFPQNSRTRDTGHRGIAATGKA